ncbi:MAG: hypothetical protein HY300_11190 [Verrucomicrobia bacterium]|nr:hypothetical protein [Verrucomicrobiota bacterium]
MAAGFDESEFVDAAVAASGRAPTRQELDSKVGDAHQKLAELKRAQEDLERERAALEEGRRRSAEFHTGRDEMLQHLTRGVGLLAEAEFGARRDAEQMAKSLAGLRDALAKVQGIDDESWTQENWNIELTRALTVIENARMEWNTARLKWLVLSGEPQNQGTPRADSAPAAGLPAQLAALDFAQLCKLGLALTWPLVLTGLGILLAVWLRGK